MLSQGQKNAVTGKHNGALRVSVTAVADKGKANQAIAEVLAKFFGLARSAVQLQSGLTSRRKRFLLRGMNAEEVGDLILSHLKSS